MISVVYPLEVVVFTMPSWCVVRNLLFHTIQPLDCINNSESADHNTNFKITIEKISVTPTVKRER